VASSTLMGMDRDAEYVVDALAALAATSVGTAPVTGTAMRARMAA